MKLLRVQVPNFRALKNVDISFEPDFTPQVFPLGSLNGGGKSTLLQLIFVLLHCSADEERHEFIGNMLDSVIIPEGETSQVLAKIDLLDDEGEKIELEFTVCNDGYLQQLDIDPIFNKEELSFRLLWEAKKSLFSYKNSKKRLEDLKSTNFKNNDVDRKIQYTNLILQFEKEIKEIENKFSGADHLSVNILKCFKRIRKFYITLSSNKKRALVCNFPNSDKVLEDVKNTFRYISEFIFLSSPQNQIYLFLEEHDKETLFQEYLGGYDRTLYRNKDFKTLVETDENGNYYKSLLEELHLFSDKKIIPQIGDDSKVAGIIFKSKEVINLKPEDLSHGELKRLSLYVWLKTMPQGGNIVLMDEVENGFHPQWQRYIADDLVEWQESNQYILATHSYELCRGVTPAHVKELSPDLFDKD